MSDHFIQAMRLSVDKRMLEHRLMDGDGRALKELTVMLEHLPAYRLEGSPMLRRAVQWLADSFLGKSDEIQKTVEDVLASSADYLANEFLNAMYGLLAYTSMAQCVQDEKGPDDLVQLLKVQIRRLNVSYGENELVQEQVSSWLEKAHALIDHETGLLYIDRVFDARGNPLVTSGYFLSGKPGEAGLDVLPLSILKYAQDSIKFPIDVLNAIHDEAFHGDHTEHMSVVRDDLMQPMVEELENFIERKGEKSTDDLIEKVGSWLTLILNEAVEAEGIYARIENEWHQTFRANAPPMFDSILDGSGRLEDLRAQLRHDEFWDHWEHWVVESGKAAFADVGKELTERLSKAIDVPSKAFAFGTYLNQLAAALSEDDYEKRHRSLPNDDSDTHEFVQSLQSIARFPQRAMSFRNGTLHGLSNHIDSQIRVDTTNELKTVEQSLQAFIDAALNAPDDDAKPDKLDAAWQSLYDLSCVEYSEDAPSRNAKIDELDMPDDLKTELKNEQVYRVLGGDFFDKLVPDGLHLLHRAAKKGGDTAAANLHSRLETMLQQIAQDLDEKMNVTNRSLARAEEYSAMLALFDRLFKTVGVAVSQDDLGTLGTMGWSKDDLSNLQVVVTKAPEKWPQSAALVDEMCEHVAEYTDWLESTFFRQLKSDFKIRAQALFTAGDQAGLTKLLADLKDVGQYLDPLLTAKLHDLFQVVRPESVEAWKYLTQEADGQYIWRECYADIIEEVEGWALCINVVLPFVVNAYRTIDAAANPNCTVLIADVRRVVNFSRSGPFGPEPEVLGEGAVEAVDATKNRIALTYAVQEFRNIYDYVQDRGHPIFACDRIGAASKKVGDTISHFTVQQFENFGRPKPNSFPNSPKIGQIQIGRAAGVMSAFLDWQSDLIRTVTASQPNILLMLSGANRFKPYASIDDYDDLDGVQADAQNPVFGYVDIEGRNAIHRISGSESLTSAYISQVRFAALQSQYLIVTCSDARLKKHLHTRATLAAVDHFEAAILDLVTPKSFHTEWPSAAAAVLGKAQRIAEHKAECLSVLAELNILKKSWNAGPKAFKTALSNACHALEDYPVIATALALLSEQDYFASSFLVERLPNLIRALEIPTSVDPDTSKFVASHILDFKLHNIEGVPELSSLEYTNIVFELINRTKQDLRLGDPIAPNDLGSSQTAGDRKCHFILRFRRGTLERDLDNIGLLSPTDDWEIVERSSFPIERPIYDQITIRGPHNHVIGANESRRLVLTGMKGDAGEGDRTTRVLMLHQGIETLTGVAKEAGEREKRLTVAHRRVSDTNAEALLPLRPGFSSSNTVLNDGVSSNDLSVEITNFADHSRQLPVSFWTIGTKTVGGADSGRTQEFWRRSKIILTLETKNEIAYQQDDWAVCSNGQAASVDVELKFPFGVTDPWIGRFMNEGEMASWVFMPPLGASQKELSLNPGRALMLKISNLKTDLANGPGRMHLDFQNIPGYPDRRFTLEVEKGPVVERGTKVGINTLPEAELHVNGSAIVSASLKTNDLEVTSQGFVTNLTANDATIQNHAKIEGTLTVDQEVNAQTDLGVGNDLVVNNNLVVKGNVTVGDTMHATVPVGTIMAFAGTTAPLGWVICDGHDLIGTQFQALRDVLGADTTPNMVGRTVIGAGSMHHGVLKENTGFDQKANTHYDPPHFPDGFGTIESGKKGGAWTHSLTQEEMPRHQHFGWGQHSLNGWDFGMSADSGHLGASSSDRDNHHFGTSWTGGKKADNTDSNGGAHINTQPYYALLYIIKY